MKVLTVVSGLDFINYTRRATIEAIHKVNPEMEILMFNSILNIRKSKIISSQIIFYNYHFWIIEKLRRFSLFSNIEYWIRSNKWKSFFNKYDTVFFIDPNQYYLLHYLCSGQKLVYLLRDPSILLDSNNFRKELPIIKRANLILAVSQNLCRLYFEKYYGFIPQNVRLWSNTVDLGLWDYSKWHSYVKSKNRPLVGLAGNIDFVIDIRLIKYIAEQIPEYDFEIAGKLDLNNQEQLIWDSVLAMSNVRYLGFIPFNDFPKIVINWDVGLVAAKPDHEYASYLNNNKQYQYLALGKPFVTFHLNAAYEEFADLVFIAESKSDYVNKIRQAFFKTKESGVKERGRELALLQSAEFRAQKFMDYLTNICN